MNPVFGGLWWDILYAALIGLAGGLAFGLLQDKGLALPHKTVDGGVTFLNFGFLSDMVVGALAAIVTYGVSQPSTQLALVLAALTAGIGGRVILKGYINGKIADLQSTLSAEALTVAEQAVRAASPPAAPLAGPAPEAGSRDFAPPAPAADVAALRDRITALQQQQADIQTRWGTP